MGRPGILALAFLALILPLAPAAAHGAAVKVLSWTVPATYEDQTEIPAGVRQTIETRLYFSLDRASWTRFATVSGGNGSWSGALPVADGTTAYYAATATIPAQGAESRLSQPVAYPPKADPAAHFDDVTAVAGGYRDTYVAPGERSSHASDPVVRVQVSSGGGVGSRAFLRWDLSTLPAGIRITGAALRLYHVGEEAGPGDGALAVSVARVVGANLDPATATWSSPDNVAPWPGGAEGGAGNLAARESLAAVGKSPGWVVWNVTNMVQEWLDAPAANFGVAIDPDVAAGPGSSRLFASREHPDPALRPELAIRYRHPSPTGSPAPSSTAADETGGALPDTFTASIGGYEDTYVNLGLYSDTNYSSEPLIRTYTWPAHSVANRGFIRWDLSGLPPGVTVMDATLLLYYVSEEVGGVDDGYTVSVAKATGVLPDLARATWNRYDGVSPWPGGQDGGATAMAPAESSTTIGKAHRWVSWDVTGMVREWVAAPESNLGMVIDADRSAGADSNRYFASREHPDPLLRPRLLITYIADRPASP